MGPSSPGAEIGSKIIAAFGCFCNLIIIHQIDVISTHFAVAFDIPIHNIGIYFDKLFSSRSLGIAIGCIVFLVYKAIDSNNVALRYMSVTASAILVLVRLIFLILLYTSGHLSYHIYIVLSVEAFAEGFFNSSLLTIAPEHTVAIALAANLPRIFILLVQSVLDQFWYYRPLLMIKIQCWICLVLTFIAVRLWEFYNFKLSPDKNKDLRSNNGEIKTVDKKGFMETFRDASSPMFMYFIGSMFRDFTYPGMLPYGLLERDKCHMINMLIPLANVVGPFTLFTLETMGRFSKWEWYFNWFWILAIPMVIIFVYCFLAFHTRIPSARAIVNSRPRVLLMTLIVAFCNGFSEPVSYVGVAKVVKPDTSKSNGKELASGEQKEGDLTLIPFHDIMALFLRFIFAKLSVGYNDTRISLGYHLPRFRPNHRMSKWNAFWYIFKNTFTRAYKDTIHEWQMNVKNYL